MKTKCVRLHGVNDLRVEEIELPEIKDDEILARITTNSVCMSDHKAADQGAAHKRVPDDVAENPIIMGHEFCGEIVKVGAKWQSKYKVGERFSIQPACKYEPHPLYAPGYSFAHCGGYSEMVVIPPHIMAEGGLLAYSGPCFFLGSLSEPVSCIIGTYHAMYHTEPGVYTHKMGIVEGGNMAIIAGVGPMGLGAIDYAIHNDRKPGLLVVTDIDDARLARAEQLLSAEDAAKNGVKLVYLNTKDIDAVKTMMDLTDGHGYDDILVMAPVKPLVEQADAILAFDGCLNFFAGPNKTDFSAMMNFYNVHYASHHVVGTSGGSTSDMVEALSMMEKGKLNPAAMITHVGGINCVPETVVNLPSIPGGKKLIYTHLTMPLTAISDFEKEGKTNPVFAELDRICKAHKNLWCAEAEKYLLSNWK
ncbi:MAG: zinc-binding dehydrogenase [Sphaerochaetaceae bacterium]